MALGLELAQVVEERVDLLRHQDRGGLVEDDDLGAAVEDLEDLHPLALADAERLDELVGVEVEAVARRRSRWISGAGRVTDAVQLLGAEHDVLEHGEVVGQLKCWKTMPMPCAIASAGVEKVTSGPLTLMVPVVGLLHAVQDLHQRGLARAVLTDEGVDGAGADRDVDVVVGDHAREALADPGDSTAGRSSVAVARRPTSLSLLTSGRASPGHT